MYAGTQQTGHCISQPANPGLLLGHYLYAGDDELDALQPFFSLGILESLAYAAPTYPSQTLIRSKSNPKHSAWPQPVTFTDGKNHHNALGKQSLKYNEPASWLLMIFMNRVCMHVASESSCSWRSSRVTTEVKTFVYALQHLSHMQFVQRICNCWQQVSMYNYI